MSEKELQERIKDILKEQRIITLSTHDENGPWAAPVFFAQKDYDIYFVSNPKSRHSRAVISNKVMAGAVYNSNSVWRDVQGLQLSGSVSILSDKKEVKEAQKIYTGKFPFTGVFFSQQDKLPAPLRAKVSDVCFFHFKPERIVLVDNSIHFGFHYEFIPA